MGGYTLGQLTAKLTPLATSTIALTLFVPLPHGSTHCPEASGAVHELPRPATGSQPALVASDWNSVMENPFGPTPLSPL
jgi:hypothetical protein